MTHQVLASSIDISEMLETRALADRSVWRLALLEPWHGELERHGTFARRVNPHGFSLLPLKHH